MSANNLMLKSIRYKLKRAGHQVAKLETNKKEVEMQDIDSIPTVQRLNHYHLWEDGGLTRILKDDRVVATMSAVAATPEAIQKVIDREENNG